VIHQLDLQRCELVTLANAKLGQASVQTQDTEFISITSALRKAGASQVLATLWPIPDPCRTWFLLRFYQVLLAQEPWDYGQAFTTAQGWLRTVTYSEIPTWLQELAEMVQAKDPTQARVLLAQGELLRRDSGKMANPNPAFGHPYCWAGVMFYG
jgi:CHAT domain-containing protein